VSQPV